ncbi:hypothetical protein F2Q69_00051946 [Brassica cretica]|uniref:Uncharacterized protein n=1 Tax=Brassica cretica TaxID=69181 RepID=A0A8S9MUW8_BRACR|nr:hypothetical protein F2Q69_00051946 [Brassica cretica]
MVKVIWDCNGQDIITWETKARMKAEYPEWLDQFVSEETFDSDSDSRTNPSQGGETCHAPNSG